jgi:hypothetical protein
MNRKGNVVFVILLVAAGILIISGGYLIYKSKVNPGPVPGNGFYSCGQDRTCALAGFGKPITMDVKNKVIFPDGLVLSLSQINDSRCRKDVVCVWAGELSAVLIATEGKLTTSSEEIIISTVRNERVSSDGYVFFLAGATENSATIIVSPASPVGGSGSVTGYLHLGPTCPVERIPPDPNCAERAYGDAKVDIRLKSSGTLAERLVSDATGSFRVDIAPGTYTITAGPKTGGFLPRCNETEVVVTANKVTNVDIFCDTGIR